MSQCAETWYTISKNNPDLKCLFAFAFFNLRFLHHSSVFLWHVYRLNERVWLPTGEVSITNDRVVTLQRRGQQFSRTVKDTLCELWFHSGVYTELERECFSQFCVPLCVYVYFLKINFPAIHIVKSFNWSQISSAVWEFQEMLPEYALLSTAWKDHVAKLDYLNSTRGDDMKEKSSASVCLFLSMFWEKLLKENPLLGRSLVTAAQVSVFPALLTPWTKTSCKR